VNRRLTALFAASEALLVVAMGIAIPLAIFTVLWGAQFGFAIDWAVFWRASVDAWLLGHGVDLTVVPDPALELGFAGSNSPVTLTIAALGFALCTGLLAVRAGRRIAETRFRGTGQLVSLATFALASFGVTFSVLHPAARPSLWQGTALPTLVFALGLVIGVQRTRREQEHLAVPSVPSSLSPGTRLAIGAALRGGAAASALLIAFAAALATAVIVASYARIITLYESLHTEVLGGVAVTIGQLAFVPNFVIWTASWLVGPGFALGEGSTISPLATQVGPLPAIPILGALPVGSLPFGFVGLLAPVVAGFVVGIVVGARLRSKITGLLLALTGVGIGLVGGLILGLLAWASAGSAGPGRLLQVGPDPVQVAAWAALELGLAASIGLFTASRRPSEPVTPPR
jgi:hypothetical protein